MSWAEIKKAVNSDLSTPLNSKIDSQTTSLTNAINALKTGGNIKCVKSVQRGTATLGSRETSKSITISSVNTSKAVVLYGGSSTGSANTSSSTNMLCYVSLSNGTTVQVNRQSFGNGWETTVTWQVIEFY